MATKCQVFDGGAIIAGTVAVYRQTEHPILISAPTNTMAFSAGGVTCSIHDISTSGWTGPDPQPDPPIGTELTFVVQIVASGMAGVVAHEFVYVSGADDDDIERSFTYNITGRQLWRTESHSPGAGRENSPVYAKELTETDSWVTLDTVTWSITFGDLSYSGSTPAPIMFQPVLAVSGLTLSINQHKGNAGVIYAEVKDLSWDQGSVNLSRYEYPSPKPGSGVYLNGKVGGFDVETVTNSSLIRAVGIAIPYIVDFSDFGVWNRDGQLKGDTRINGPFQASNHYAPSLTWSDTP